MSTDYPRPIRVLEHVWIPVRDGTRLAARIWLPADAEADPVPALVEYIPYRKNDGTAVRDSQRHPYFAGHGYASIRVDMRGSGDSDGVLMDEYLPLEQQDAVDVFEWIAAQPWCTGAIGMFGKSWGGFNALQVAAWHPPQLKAIITLCSTDDRYADDVHYMGGCVLASNALAWASTMLAFNGRPPDPAVLGEQWRSVWLRRLAETPPYIETWLRHQRRDAYWKQGSVCEDFASITCPVYAIGGWADGYTNAVPRLLEGLSCPRKGLIGPWGHQYPDEGKPGPAIGFLQEALRWWDYWLKGIETGVMDGPMLRAWLLDSVEADPDREHWPGRWVAEPAWPSPTIRPRRFYLNAGGVLAEAPAPAATVAVIGAQRAGLDAGTWCPAGRPGDLPPDQGEEDRLWSTFTTGPLAERLDILGFPEVTLSLTSDRPRALVAVRLCDVSPTGASTLITRGVLNLTHRKSHEHPEPLVPGEPFQATVRLSVIGYSVPAGHRLRVAVSPTYWPTAWPSPEVVTLSLHTGAGCCLHLPVRAPRPEDLTLPDFGPPVQAEPIPTETLRKARVVVTRSIDPESGAIRVIHDRDGGRSRQLASGLEYESHSIDTYTIEEGRPLSAAVRCERRISVGRGDWSTSVETVSTMTSDLEHFYVENELVARAGAETVFSRRWRFQVERDLQ